MADDQSPKDRAKRLADELVDLAIYAPLGAVATLADELPELVRRGRDRFGGQVRLAQMFGKIAADSAKRQAEGFVRGRSGPTPSKTAGDAQSSPTERPPFAGYDGLVATEVISRLEHLAPEALRALRAYEQAHRNRRTVLGRIAQLLANKPKN
ncbi:MAG: hypothetical protein WB770_09985 [Acidimicrobiales bacterium]